jgi:hypothetical protein
LPGANVNTSAIDMVKNKSKLKKQKHSKPKINRIPQIGDDKPEIPIVSIIVTIYADESYDDLFRSVHSLSLFSVGYLFKILANQDDVLAEEDLTSFIQICKELIEDISQVDSNCVLFNYECCSACEGKRITEHPYSLDVINMTKYCLDKGYMVVFSDFAV